MKEGYAMAEPTALLLLEEDAGSMLLEVVVEQQGKAYTFITPCEIGIQIESELYKYVYIAGSWVAETVENWELAVREFAPGSYSWAVPIGALPRAQLVTLTLYLGYYGEMLDEETYANDVPFTVTGITIGE
jgi:hypothetical protein